jgi:hypothetical protein
LAVIMCSATIWATAGRAPTDSRIWRAKPCRTLGSLSGPQILGNGLGAIDDEGDVFFVELEVACRQAHAVARSDAQVAFDHGS